MLPELEEGALPPGIVVEAGSGMPFLDFFQQDSLTGQPRGIVELRVEDWG